jgi:hypothetical protein
MHSSIHASIFALQGNVAIFLQAGVRLFFLFV